MPLRLVFCSCELSLPHEVLWVYSHGYGIVKKTTMIQAHLEGDRLLPSLKPATGLSTSIERVFIDVRVHHESTNSVVPGDLNLDFDKPGNDRGRILEPIEQLNERGDKEVNAWFSFFHSPPKKRSNQ